MQRELFLAGAIDAETAAANQRVAEELAKGPRLDENPPEVARQARESGQSRQGPVVRLDQAIDRTVAGPGGDVPVRLLVPDRVDGVLLYMHGGGWVFGRGDQQDESLWEIATQCNVATVSVDYRLAPEHPYPAGPDDCEAAAVWAVEQARAEFGTDRIVIGGGSAGGHLAAVTALRMRDKHGYTGFAGADLVYGVYELSGGAPSQRIIGRDSMLIDEQSMNWFYDQFLQAGEDRRDPDISPVHAELHDLPPALFTIGTLDPLLDDSLFMYARWIAAGNEAELAVYPGGVHGFNGFPTELGRNANEKRRQFIGERIEATATA